MVHALIVPVFLAGTCAVGVGLAGWWWVAAAGGLGAMVLAVALQGRTHRLETTRPVPFDGPLDVVARLFAEQWITFPRFVLSGAFRRAWQAGTPAEGDPRS